MPLPNCCSKHSADHALHDLWGSMSHNDTWRSRMQAVEAIVKPRKMRDKLVYDCLMRSRTPCRMQTLLPKPADAQDPGSHCFRTWVGMSLSILLGNLTMGLGCGEHSTRRRVDAHCRFDRMFACDILFFFRHGCLLVVLPQLRAYHGCTP